MRDDWGLVGAIETDPRRTAATDPLLKETETAVCCGYELRVAVAVDLEPGLARWPHPGTERAQVREALADEIDETLATAGEPEWPASVTVESAGDGSGAAVGGDRGMSVEPNRHSVSHTVRFGAPHELTADDETTLVVDDYEDVGSMYIFELPDGTTRSVGKQLVESVTDD